MAAQKITIEQFIAMAKSHPLLDVRSPGEYLHAHVPGSHSIPLFTDEERIVVGTAYKQESREQAIKIGLDYFGLKMRRVVEEAENLIALVKKETKKNNTSNPPLGDRGSTVLVHCWRGGMRSAGIAWLLDLYGFKVYTLIGGYKAYRKWVREQFEKKYPLTIVGGYTGSGKTLIIQQLQQTGNAVIDLEGLANHKGSAFGALGEKPQPSQEMFENMLAEALAEVNSRMAEDGVRANNHQATAINNPTIWLEDESQRIGNLQIPMPFWENMRSSPIRFVDIPFEQRLDYLTIEYGRFEKEKLVNAVMRIQKRLGGLETKNAVNHLLENNHKECFRILLTYYDKWYLKGLHNREGVKTLLQTIACNEVDAVSITNILTHEKTLHS
jgi:tRNA 2-selenouridine synthase